MKHLSKILLLLCVISGQAMGADGGAVVAAQPNSASAESFQPNTRPLNDVIQSAYVNKEDLELTVRPFSQLQDHLTTVVTGMEELDQQTLRNDARAITFIRSVQHQQSVQNFQQSSKLTHVVNLTGLVSTIRNRLNMQHQQDLLQQLAVKQEETRKATLKSLSFWQKNPRTNFMLGFTTAGFLGIGGCFAYLKYCSKKPANITPVTTH